MLSHTSDLFDSLVQKTSTLFEAKTRDYGSAWRVLRPSSLTDQIYIKIRRIINLQSGIKQQVDEGQAEEFIGVFNYAIMGVIQLEMGVAHEPDLSIQEALETYLTTSTSIAQLLEKKNNDYGEAWKEMRLTSITDLILQKIIRIKQIEDNHGKTEVSEGLDAGYMDMAIYAFFCLVKLNYIN